MRNAVDCFIAGIAFAFGVAVAAVLLKTIFHFQLLT